MLKKIKEDIIKVKKMMYEQNGTISKEIKNPKIIKRNSEPEKNFWRISEAEMKTAPGEFKDRFEHTEKIIS